MKILRILGFIVLGLVVLGGALVSYMYISTTRRINATYEVPEVADIPLPTDAASLAEGQRLFFNGWLCGLPRCQRRRNRHERRAGDRLCRL
jgi:hypothetical protein